MTSPTTSAALLAVERVTRRYGALTAIDDVSLHVVHGERLALTGPNGAGKSTLLSLIDGTVTATSGTIAVDGTDITAWPAYRRARAGITRVFQQPQCAVRLTVRDNILLALRHTRTRRTGTRLLPARPATARLLNDWALHLAEQTGLAALAATTAGQLSYGHRRQLDLAIALAAQPQLLLLDEPTAGLAHTETEKITALIAALPPTLTVILVEHDPAVIDQLATRTVCLDAGTTTAGAA